MPGQPPARQPDGPEPGAVCPRTPEDICTKKKLLSLEGRPPRFLLVRARQGLRNSTPGRAAIRATSSS